VRRRNAQRHPYVGTSSTSVRALVASLAVGVPLLAAPLRFCVFADERRVLTGDAGGRAPTRKRSALPPGSAAPQAATSTELRFAQTHGKLCPRLQARLSVLIG
jgi:hypothetical protein